MSKESIYHIIRAKDGWRVILEGAEQVLDSHESLNAAASAARDLALANKPARIILHDRDGSIKAEKTFGARGEGLPGERNLKS